MRRILIFAVGTLLVGLLSPVAAMADSQVDLAIKELRSSNVYVSPGAPDSNSETAATLGQALTSGDQVALVMLSDSGVSPLQAAAQIDKATKRKLIIGISAGDQVAGYSKALPEGVASDLMSRANSIASSNVEVLRTFAQLSHKWQHANPEQVKKPPQKKEEGSGLWVIFPIILFLMLVAVIGIVLFGGDDDQIKFRSPSNVRDELQKIYNQREEINNYSLQETVDSMCRDTEAFFKRSKRSSDHDTTAEALGFARQLGSVRQVIDRYIDVQENPRYYENPEKALQDGQEAIEAFAEFVLKAVQRNSAAELINLVDTKILKATRYN